MIDEEWVSIMKKKAEPLITVPFCHSLTTCSRHDLFLNTCPYCNTLINLLVCFLSPLSLFPTSNSGDFVAASLHCVSYWYMWLSSAPFLNIKCTLYSVKSKIIQVTIPKILVLIDLEVATNVFLYYMFHFSVEIVCYWPQAVAITLRVSTMEKQLI